MNRTSDIDADRPQDYLDFPGAETLLTAGRVEPPRAGTTAAAQAVLRAAIERDAAAPRTRPAVLSARPRLALTALAAALAAGLVAYPALTPHDAAKPQRPQAASARTFLTDMAEIAAAEPATKAPYWKTTLNLAVPADGEKESTHTRYLDRTGKSTEVRRDGSTEVVLKGAAYPVGDRTLSWDELDRLPTSPKALAALLPTSHYAGGKAQSTFDNATALLGESPAGPRLRAALYRVLAGLPGVEVTGPAKDAAGRTGTALERSTRSGTIRLIVDPATGDLLQETETAPGTDTLQARYTYLFNGPADTLG